jgi:hypothetical protein
MKKRIWGCAVLSAAAMLIGTATLVHADTLLPYTVGGYATACCQVPGNYDTNYMNPGSDPGTLGYVTINDTNGTSTASVAASSGTPVLNATSSGAANSEADLTFYMELVSYAGNVSGVAVLGPGSVTASPGTNTSFTSARGYVSTCSDAACSSTTGQVANIYDTLADFTPGGTYDYNLSFNMDSGVVYQVYLYVLAFGTASITLDPIFTINDPNAQNYSLEFSKGIPNGTPPSATPIPMTLPLLFSGLGVLGLLTWPGKKQKAIAA